MQRTAIVIGATGLIGRNLVFELLKSEKYCKVTVFARRDLVIKHDKLKQVLLDFDHLEAYSKELVADDIFCCLGSTKAKTPDIIAYRKIDFDYPLEVAKLTKINGAKSYFLISSMGANKNSTIFYSKLKGEIEEAIATIGFASFHVFRPSLLLGSRTESRPMETISQYFMRVLNPLFIGPLRLYKAVEGIMVAKAMMIVASKNLSGYHLWLNNQILDLVDENKKK